MRAGRRSRRAGLARRGDRDRDRRFGVLDRFRAGGDLFRTGERLSGRSRSLSLSRSRVGGSTRRDV